MRNHKNKIWLFFYNRGCRVTPNHINKNMVIFYDHRCKASPNRMNKIWLFPLSTDIGLSWIAWIKYGHFLWSRMWGVAEPCEENKIVFHKHKRRVMPNRMNKIWLFSVIVDVEVTSNRENKILIFFLIANISVTPITSASITIVKKKKNPCLIGSWEHKEESSQCTKASEYWT